MNLKGTITEKNLQTALQGEALAHLKYQLYKNQLSKTSKDLENKLEEISHNEKEHAKIWFKLLHDGGYPDDLTNIQDAIAGETYESKEMYPEFARIAREEGLYDIADLFEEVACIEKKHKEEFTKIFNNIENKELFEDKNEQTWKCLNCGHIHNGRVPPKECPVCKHPLKYFVRD